MLKSAVRITALAALLGYGTSHLSKVGMSRANYLAQERSS